MKKDIHPKYHEINVVMTDGSSFKTRSTFGKPGETLRLDIDPKTHPAWTGVSRVSERGGRMAKFKERFGSIGAAKEGVVLKKADGGKPEKAKADAKMADAPKADAKSDAKSDATPDDAAKKTAKH